MAKVVSLKQIANIADVSVGTVSRVLRSQGRVSEKTRHRVLEAAKQLKYRPNLLVRGLQTGQTGNVGLLMNHRF